MITAIAAHSFRELADVVSRTKPFYPLLERLVTRRGDNAELSILKRSDRAGKERRVLALKVGHVKVGKGNYHVLRSAYDPWIMVVEIHSNVWVSGVAMLVVMHIPPLEWCRVRATTVFAAE